MKVSKNISMSSYAIVLYLSCGLLSLITDSHCGQVRRSMQAAGSYVYITQLITWTTRDYIIVFCSCSRQRWFSFWPRVARQKESKWV